MFLGIDDKPESTIAIIDNFDQVITYGELCAVCRADKNVISDRAVVFILCRNTVGAVSSYISCVENGAVPLLLSASIDESLLEHLLKAYEPSYIIAPKDLAVDGQIIGERFDYCLRKLENKKYPVYPELELLMTTSGSTGSPKLVRYKRGNLEYNAKNVALAFGWTNQERPICDLAMNYTMGLNVINTHLYVGSTVVLTTYNLMSMDFWNYVKEKKCTNFTGVPFSYDILTRLRFTRMDLPYLTTFAEGGGKLTDQMFTSLAQFAKEKGKRFIATFGTTETSARMSLLPPEKALEKVGSIGKAIPNGELFLLDEDGKEIGAMEADGELGYRGPNVTLGYAVTKEELMKGDDFCGEYHTGDIAHRDAEGYYYIIGRKSRFLKLLGYRINLEQCERLIKEKFRVECACVGTDKKMIIYIAANEENTGNAVIEFISNTLNLYNSLFEIREIQCIPKNESGKILYSKLANE